MKTYRYTPKGRFTIRNSQLKRNFGITIEDYNSIYTRQNGCCILCGRNQSKLSHTLHVDHDHKNGKVRGLLCKPCNTKMGWFDKHKEQILDYINSSQILLEPPNQ